MRLLWGLLFAACLSGCSSSVGSVDTPDIGKTIEARSKMLVNDHEVVVCSTAESSTEISQGVYAILRAMLVPKTGESPLPRARAQHILDRHISPSSYRLINVGTPVRVLKRSDDWVFVEVLDGTHKGFEGYICQLSAPATEAELKQARDRIYKQNKAASWKPVEAK